MRQIRRYSELIKLDGLEARYEYLRLGSKVGEETFGWDRYFNQTFYRSREWKRVRDFVLMRDDGCDLGVPGFQIPSFPIIHHMNPMVVNDLKYGNKDILNPEFLITTSTRTHQAIHYGDKSILPQVPISRRSGDTKLW